MRFPDMSDSQAVLLDRGFNGKTEIRYNILHGKQIVKRL